MLMEKSALTQSVGCSIIRNVLGILSSINLTQLLNQRKFFVNIIKQHGVNMLDLMIIYLIIYLQGEGKCQKGKCQFFLYIYSFIHTSMI